MRAFRRGLLAWYARHGRDLPWRRTRDPYEILVSEVMLQQTQVKRVLEYFPRFLARYPTAADLATATAGEVREAWDGLGYYRRASNLQRAAQEVAERHGGRFPSSPEELVRLPGIGRYTAGAVASFAFGLDAAIPPGRGYPFNQGIMDLGALVCTARRPACPRCPVRRACRTARATAGPKRSRTRVRAQR